jgi:hypothetical protein
MRIFRVLEELKYPDGVESWALKERPNFGLGESLERREI